MLDTLRKKKEHTRIMIAGAGALVITGIVVAFWIWSSSGRFSSSRKVVEDTHTKPLQVLSSSIKEIFAGYKKDTSAPQESILEPGDSLEENSSPQETYQDPAFEFESNFTESETSVDREENTPAQESAQDANVAVDEESVIPSSTE